MAGLYKRTTFGLFFALLFSFSASPAFAFLGIPPDFPEKDPVIIVPGIVGSFNLLSLFADTSGGLWGPVPFNNIYAGLIARFEAEGYLRNDTLYTAYYDWRQGNDASAAEYLAPIIAEAREKTGKVDIVAHSMGGLLVQAYMKSDAYEPGQIDQFIMLGTPNEGASAAYLPWEGGLLSSTWSAPVKFYINTIHSSLRSVREIEDVAPKSYRQIFPSLKELLPTGQFLQKGGSGQASLERNTFLEGLDAVRDSLIVGGFVNTTTIAGTNNNTLGEIELSETRTETDETLDRWRDGHPTQEVPSPNSSAGDKTVLSSSAWLFGTIQDEVSNVPHDALPEHAQDEVLEALGIEIDKPKVFIYEEPEWLTGFVVLSPVDIVITDSTGKTISKDTNDFGDDAYVDVISDTDEHEPKLVIIKNLPNGIYTVHLTGTGVGEYTVIVTNTTPDASTTKTITGTTTLGKEESFTVTLSDGDASVSELTSEDETEEAASPVPNVVQGKGDEKDCCPGPDIKKEVKPIKKGRVLGISTQKAPKRRYVSLEQMKPLNEVFFAVYGRLPTYEEWKYWADRYLTDKPTWETLKGTMQWWKNKGISLPPLLGTKIP